MRFLHLYTVLAIAAFSFPRTGITSQASTADKNKTVAEATGGQFKTTKGRYFDKTCKMTSV